MIFPKTYNYIQLHTTQNFTQVAAVTIIIYMAWNVHTTYIMFLECFFQEACQVSELTTDLWPKERSLVVQRMPPIGHCIKAG